MPKTSPYCNAYSIGPRSPLTGDRWYWRANVKCHMCAIKISRDTRYSPYKTHTSPRADRREIQLQKNYACGNSCALCFYTESYMHYGRSPSRVAYNQWCLICSCAIAKCCEFVQVSYLFSFFSGGNGKTECSVFLPLKNLKNWETPSKTEELAGMKFVSCLLDMTELPLWTWRTKKVDKINNPSYDPSHWFL